MLTHYGTPKACGMRRPTKAELQAAVGNTVPDVIAHGLVVLFVGINPGLYSAAVAHHFARPGNRFWPALYESGFTPCLLRPDEDGELLRWGLGITNLVSRATAAASELSAEELRRGRATLEGKVAQYSPEWTAFVGIGAYATAFGRRKVSLGLQEERIAGSYIWLLPNTSGLNAHYTPTRFAELLGELRVAARGTDPGSERQRMTSPGVFAGSGVDEEGGRCTGEHRHRDQREGDPEPGRTRHGTHEVGERDGT